MQRESQLNKFFTAFIHSKVYYGLELFLLLLTAWFTFWITYFVYHMLFNPDFAYLSLFFLRYTFNLITAPGYQSGALIMSASIAMLLAHGLYKNIYLNVLTIINFILMFLMFFYDAFSFIENDIFGYTLLILCLLCIPVSITWTILLRHYKKQINMWKLL